MEKNFKKQLLYKKEWLKALMDTDTISYDDKVAMIKAEKQNIKIYEKRKNNI